MNACALPAAAFREKDARDIVMAAQVRDRIFIRPTFVRSEERFGGALLPSLVEDVIGGVSRASDEHVHQRIVMMKRG